MFQGSPRLAGGSFEAPLRFAPRDEAVGGTIAFEPAPDDRGAAGRGLGPRADAPGTEESFGRAGNGNSLRSVPGRGILHSEERSLEGNDHPESRAWFCRKPRPWRGWRRCAGSARRSTGRSPSSFSISISGGAWAGPRRRGRRRALSRPPPRLRPGGRLPPFRRSLPLRHRPARPSRSPPRPSPAYPRRCWLAATAGR